MKSKDYVKFNSETLLKRIKIKENFIGSPLMLNKIEKKLHNTLENFNKFQLPNKSKYNINLTPFSDFRKKINLNKVLLVDINKKTNEDSDNISLLKKIIKNNKNNKINFKEFIKNKDLIEKFSRNYNKLLILDKKKSNNKLKALKDIEDMYISKNYKLPKNIFKKNIFNESPLLMTSKSEINTFFCNEKIKQEKDKNYIPNLKSEKYLTNTFEYIERKKIKFNEKLSYLNNQNNLQEDTQKIISNNYKSISEDQKEIKNLYQYLNNLDKEKEEQNYKSNNLIKIEINDPININEINNINKEYNSNNTNNELQLGQTSLFNSSSMLSPNNTKSTNFFSFQKSSKQSKKKLTLVNLSPKQTFLNNFRREGKHLTFKKKRFSQTLILNNNSFYSNDKNLLISDKQSKNNNNNSISKTYELIKKTYSSNNIFNHQKKVQQIVENYCKSQKLNRNKLYKINIQNNINSDNNIKNVFNIIKKDLILPEKTLKKIELNESLENKLIQLNKKLINGTYKK